MAKKKKKRNKPPGRQLSQKQKQRKPRTKSAKEKGSSGKIWIALSLAVLSFLVQRSVFPPDTVLIETNASRTGFQFAALLFSVLTGVLVFFQQKNWAKQVAKYVFLALLLFFLSESFLRSQKFTSAFLFEHPAWALWFDFLFVPGFFVGAVGLWLHRAVLRKQMTENPETKAIEERSTHFEQRHARRAKIPVVGALLRGLYVQGWRNLAVLGVFLIVGAFVFSYQLGQFDIFSDEVQVVRAAKGYAETGEYTLYDFFKEQPTDSKYKRAFPHTWLVAQSFKIFGISAWSARIISVCFGVIFLLVAYFMLSYFFRNRYLPFVVLLAYMLFFQYLHLFRYTRMYAFLIPVFALTVWFLYRAFTQEQKLSFLKGKTADFVQKNLNFHYTYLLLGLAFFYLSYLLHPISFIALPALLVLLVYLAAVWRKPKYFYALGIGALAFMVLSFTHIIQLAFEMITFFEKENFMYVDYLAEFPFSTNAFFLIAASGLALLLISKSKLSARLMQLYALTLVAFIFFIYLVEYKGFAFRFVSHVKAFSIGLGIVVFFLINRAFYPKLLQIGLLGVLLASIGASYSRNFENTYIEQTRFGEPSVAYQTIKDNFSEGQAIFGQYLQTYYLRESELKGDVQLVNMKSNREYSFAEFFSDIKQYESGWVTWQSAKSYHLDPLILQFCRNYLKKYHGTNIDDTRNAVFFFEQKMLEGIGESPQEVQRHMQTNIYMHLEQGNSVAFWFRTTAKKPGAPIGIGKPSASPLKIESDSVLNGGLRFSYRAQAPCASIATGALNDGQWHHIVWYQESGKKGAEWGLYVDGKKHKTCTLPQAVEGRQQVQIFPVQGEMQELRLYGFALSPEQIALIYNGGQWTLQQELMLNGVPFRPFGFWTRR